MMQTSTGYNATVSQLGMGDRFQVSQHGMIITVAWTDASCTSVNRTASSR